ncbi:MAG: hypothetical protein MJZ50_10695 [Treponema sp.]|nr:hypothetical protein [Treponema sp.]
MKILCKILSLALTALFVSCSARKDKTIIIWTNNTDVVSYVELFNATHSNAKAVVVYKKEPARSLPPAQDESTPDIIIGPWLKNSSTRKNFSPIDYLFQEKTVNRHEFYSQVIDYGRINSKQYLIPVSFNLPAIMFNSQNEGLIAFDHLLDLDQVRATATEFNKLNRSDAFTAIGYAPSWDPDFLYTATKLSGAEYREKGTSFLWEQDALADSIKFLKNWTIHSNNDTTTEQNFQFRYLYMPKYRQVAGERCLFAYTTSNRFFTLTDAQSSILSFRWLVHDNKIPVEDDIVTLGLYNASENKAAAELFIGWLFKEETQQKLIERTENMKLDSVNFGIAGGFSSLRNVNEKYYPAFYRQLLGNMPPENFLVMPNILPFRWESLKANVIIPYLVDTTSTEEKKSIPTLEERIAEWTKQFY